MQTYEPNLNLPSIPTLSNKSMARIESVNKKTIYPFQPKHPQKGIRHEDHPR